MRANQLRLWFASGLRAAVCAAAHRRRDERCWLLLGHDGKLCTRWCWI